MRGKRRGPINNIVWEAISKTSFYSSAHNVKEWRSKATSLFKVAHILPPLIDNEWARQPAYKLIEVRNVYLMLVGYSFEGLGKALLIQKQSPIAKNGTFIHISHNLIDIFSKAGFEVTNEEEFLLERLEQYIVWAGRYPIPKEYKALLPREYAIDHNPFNLGYDADADPALIMSLYKRILRELANRAKKQKGQKRE